MTDPWDGRANFTSYDEVEAAANYRGTAELEAYRAERLAFGATRARFALSQSAVPVPAKVIEIGAGSSALLYAMEIDGVLEHAIAIEISRSRHEFAERWKADKGFARVQNRCADFANVALDPDWADLFLCLDNTLSYIGAEGADYPRRLIDKAFAALRPGGALLVEIHNQAKVIGALRDNERQFRVELPATNAFKFALYRQTLDRAKNWLRSESVYIGVNGNERRKLDLETIFDRAAIETLLVAGDFENPQCFGDYGGAPFDLGRSDYLIVLARKPGR